MAEEQRQRDLEQQRVCEQARNMQTALTSGVRVARPDVNGERVYLDDATRAAEIERNQKFLDENCR